MFVPYMRPISYSSFLFHFHVCPFPKTIYLPLLNILLLQPCTRHTLNALKLKSIANMMKSNLIMIVDVLALLLDPHHGAYVRSAGWVGADAFQEVVERGLVPLVARSCFTLVLRDVDESADGCAEGGVDRFPVAPISRRAMQVGPEAAAVMDAEDDDDAVVGAGDAERPPPMAHVLGPSQNIIGDVQLNLAPLLTMMDGSGCELHELFTPTFCQAAVQRLELHNFPCSAISSEDIVNIVSFAEVRHVSFLAPQTATITTSSTSTTIDPIMAVPASFLRMCTTLWSVDLSIFSSAVRVEGQFMERCMRLTTINLSPLTNVTSIGNFFLRGSSGLTKIDLTPLKNVRDVGDGFFSDCRGLRRVDLSPMRSLWYIKPWFFSGCQMLSEVKFGMLPRLGTIGLNCFTGNSSMKSLDLSGLMALSAEPVGLADRCPSVKLPPHLERRKASLAASRSQPPTK